jgi:pyruvate kinase
VTFTKIIATLGPACDDKTTVESMRDAGLNCVRINTAHGDIEQYEDLLGLVDDDPNIATVIDVKGPQIRIELDNAVTLAEDETFSVGFEEGDMPRLNYDLFDDLSVDDTVFFDEGYVETKVVTKESGRVVLRAEHDATIKPGKGVNIPGSELGLPALTPKDKHMLRFGKKHGVDYVAQSFVRRPGDLAETKEILGDDPMKIIAKIENHEGVDNLLDIISSSDGVMIARGDLGVELPQQRIPAVQKRIVRETARQSKISVVATQMLESMTENPKPTRAEVSDVANAVLDGTDAVMLSGETAIGSHPVGAVRTMRDVSAAIENDISTEVVTNDAASISEDMSRAASTVAQHQDADAFVVVGEGTRQTRLLSRYRLNTKIISVTETPRVARQLNLVWGAESVLVEELPREHIIPRVAKNVFDAGLIGTSDTVVFYAGVGTDNHEAGNLVETHKIGDFLAYHGLLSR